MMRAGRDQEEMEQVWGYFTSKLAPFVNRLYEKATTKMTKLLLPSPKRTADKFWNALASLMGNSSKHEVFKFTYQ
jgi:hypothetical protein